MKKVFLPLFLGILLTVFGCQKETPLFKLTGNIPGLSDSTVMLYGLFSVPDSVIEIPVKDGKFSCTLPLDTITPMYLRLGDSRMEYPVFADKGVNITIKGDTAQLHRLTITGGKAQEEYNAFQDSIAHLDNYIDIRQEADSFIVKHPQSVVSIYLIQKYFVNVPYPNKSLIESMIDQLSGNMHDNHYISRLQNSLPKQTSRDKRLQMPALPDTTGKTIDINEYKDKFIILSLWASWHPESVEMQDSLQAIIKKFAKRPAKFVSLSLDSHGEAWLDTLRSHKWGGLHLCDFKGWNNELVEQTETQDLPTLYIANTSSKIIATDMWGKQLENFLDNQISNWEELQKKRAKEEKKRKNRR